MRSLRPLLAVVAALVFAPAALPAQGPATVTGRATNPQGQPEAGVMVRIEAPERGRHHGRRRHATASPSRRPASARGACRSRPRARGLATVSRSDDAERRARTSRRTSRWRPNALMLEGLVVTALGIERRSARWAWRHADRPARRSRRVEPNVVNSLSGKVPGVNITNAGPQGGSSRIVIRGENSITGNNQPLFVVDGVPIDNYSTGGYLNTGQGGFDYGNALQDIDPEAHRVGDRAQGAERGGAVRLARRQRRRDRSPPRTAAGRGGAAPRSS